MTTSVKVSAHCAGSKQVRISRSVPGEQQAVSDPDVVIQDGETYEQVVYDDFVISVKEEQKPE